MNEALLTRNLWLEYIFMGLPATILITKMILEHVFSKITREQSNAAFRFKNLLEKKYNCFDFYNFYNYDAVIMRDDQGGIIYDEEKKEVKKLSPEEVNKKYPDLESDYQKLKKLENVNPKIKKISYFLNRLSADDFGWWFAYGVVSWLLLFVCAVAIGCSNSEFNSEKAFYDNGKYTTIANFEEYESLPDWNKNAKVYILDAEDINDKYFNKDGSFKPGVLGYIIPDENGKYPILDDDGKPTGKYLESINTNQMYKSFLKICQSEEEVIR